MTSTLINMIYPFAIIVMKEISGLQKKKLLDLGPLLT